MRKDWIEYYLDIAEVVSTKSKDKSTKVGALIIDQDNQPVSMGFNGFIKGCDESHFSWTNRDVKYMGVVHAERNAMDFSNKCLKGCVMFCTHGPCDECLKSMLNKGIRTVYYRDASIMVKRGTDVQKEAIARLIHSTGAIVLNENGKEYLTELKFDGISTV